MATPALQALLSDPAAVQTAIDQLTEQYDWADRNGYSILAYAYGSAIENLKLLTSTGD